MVALALARRLGRVGAAVSGYCIRVATLPGYPHSPRVFADHAESCGAALAEAGLYNDKGRPLWFGANLAVPVPADAIIMQMEAHSSGWMTDAYLDLLRQHPVLDYAQENVSWLRARGVDARYCPIRHHPHLTRLTLLPEAERDIDILFYGSVTDRRQEIIQEVRAQNPQRKIIWLGHDGWDSRDGHIARAKIVLNLHAYDGAPLEMARISFLLANRCFVISERPADPEFLETVMFQSAAGIATACWIWLRDPHGRQVVAERGYQEFSQMDQQSVLVKALGGL